MVGRYGDAALPAMAPDAFVGPPTSAQETEWTYRAQVQVRDDADAQRAAKMKPWVYVLGSLAGLLIVGGVGLAVVGGRR